MDKQVTENSDQRFRNTAFYKNVHSASILTVVKIEQLCRRLRCQSVLPPPFRHFYVGRNVIVPEIFKQIFS